MEGPLPVHGFVLAGGKSTRMGVDKASMPFRGRPMVEIALEKLRSFCAEVGIAGNREDLAGYATVTPETRMDAGPAAGIEAGMMAATQPWVMFVPVDVPLVPVELLRNWARDVIEKGNAGCAASFLLVNKDRQPAFCAMRTECAATVTAALEGGERRLANILMNIDADDEVGWLWVCDAAIVAPIAAPTSLEMEFWFSNVNTQQELAEAQAWASARDETMGMTVNLRGKS
jgi:molybdopterin-guanine dinucleotide biosynthesis protein A